ncbi:SH3 domain-containing protein [Fusarium falciforme]|uniref:SH3 domain-containing protein n=1 Tax=Fusarium falciforme TaxID=195108 RepID=UPI00230150E5|nr:SH3 domain-containing protein [Fusarium falciforme]WAO90874.1 SH3 domain-containing protein [Fusarium falciforme]
MTRPTIVRADTIDLQDHHAPSAQDHSKSARTITSPNSLSPHQAETIREVISGTADEERRSPRVSWENGNGIDDIHRFADDLVAGPTGSSSNSNSRLRGAADDDDDDINGKMVQEDALAIAQNGGISSSDEGDLDGDADDLDDDMMDKISSSPSIEDGGCSPVIAPRAWPRRISSLPGSLRSSSPTPSGSSVTRVCSPYPEPLSYTPSPGKLAQLPRALPATIQNHRLRGEYIDRDDDADETDSDSETDTSFDSITAEFHETPEDEKERRGMEVQKEGIFYDCKSVLNLSDTSDEETHEQENEPDNDFDNYDLSLTVPYEESYEDDDSSLSLPSDPSYVDSGWATECLQETEDIDFEFVYALHTFVATVEGQANATKGDTMVLLDDSNSYWWLVRVVKDSSIGYLPAEHIETPTERLARLNKHRNVDLSATMLGDQTDKKQPTFKPSIRLRRKTVTFAAPTYVDYSDFDDYSTDEEDLDDLFGQSTTKSTQQQEQKKDTQQATTISVVEDDDSAEESAKVEPLKPRSNVKLVIEPTKVETVEEEDETRSSEEILLDSKLEGPSKSRNGTVRNTDSFYRDETVETKKITLTPNLLRDDNQPRPSQDSITKDIKSRTSLDKMDKELMSDKEKKKIQDKARKEKEKKPSAIRSFFSRKDKKKSIDDDDESFGKRSMDIVSESRDSESIEEVSSPVQRNPSKLQKQMPRTEPSLSRKNSVGSQEQSSTRELAAYLAESRTNDVSNVPPASMRLVDPETQETQELPSNTHVGGDVTRARSASAAAQHDDTKALAKALGRSASTGTQPRTARTVKPRPLTNLDELESSEDDYASEPEAQPTQEPVKEQKAEGAGLRPQLPGAFPDSFEAAPGENSAAAAATSKEQQQDRLSESPVHVSPVNVTRPPALEIDTSSQEGRSSSEVPSPELMPGADTPKDSSSTRSNKEAGWDDEKLRAFFDDGEHVRDLLMVVYDKTDVEPVGKDHPVVSGLFREQNAKLAEITTQLDNMLGDWLARKQRLRGTL